MILFFFRKKYAFFFFELFFVFASYSQCTVTPTLTYNIADFVCNVSSSPLYNSGIIKFNLSPLLQNSIYQFSTFGQSIGDTHLYLYQRDGTLIADNEDNSVDNTFTYTNKQSVLYFKPQSNTSNGDYYIILSKANCELLDFDVTLQYNVTPSISAKIVDPTGGVNACTGNSYTLTYSDKKAGSWLSSNTTVATINSNTGRLTFINEGKVKITVENQSSCLATKNYNVVKTITSAISHN
jgi:hypothetical protein